LLNNIVLCITIYILYCPISFQIAVLELLWTSTKYALHKQWNLASAIKFISTLVLQIFHERTAISIFYLLIFIYQILSYMSIKHDYIIVDMICLFFVTMLKI
jgi:hypothetical protein